MTVVLTVVVVEYSATFYVGPEETEDKLAILALPEGKLKVLVLTLNTLPYCFPLVRSGGKEFPYMTLS